MYIIIYNLNYHSLSHSLIGFIMARTTSINFLSSALNSCNTYFIKSIRVITTTIKKPYTFTTILLAKIIIYIEFYKIIN